MSDQTQELTTLEKLQAKHFEVFGDSPEFSFFGWLDAIGATANETELKEILNDPDYWIKNENS